MTYEVIILGHLHMPLYFIGTFTEYSYLNYSKNEICQPDDNSPVGIVLGTKKDEPLIEYALQGIDNQLFAARYQ